MKLRYAILILFIAGPVAAGELVPASQISNSQTLEWKGVKKPIDTTGNYFMPTGFTFEAVLENALFSYNLLTPALAIIDENVTYLGQLVIPRGTRFIGLVQTVHSIDRVNIAFHTCVFPDGQEIAIQGQALDFEDGSAGIKGKVKKHKDAVAARIAMKSVFAAVSAGAQLAGPSVEGTMVTGLSTEAMQSIETADPKVAVSIYVEERKPIKVFLIKRVDY